MDGDEDDGGGALGDIVWAIKFDGVSGKFGRCVMFLGQRKPSSRG